MERSAVCGGGEVDGRVERSRARGGGRARGGERASGDVARGSVARVGFGVARGKPRAHRRGGAPGEAGGGARDSRRRARHARGGGGERRRGCAAPAFGELRPRRQAPRRSAAHPKGARGSAKTRRSRRRVRRRRQGARGDRTTARRRPLGISGDVRVREDGVRGGGVCARGGAGASDDDADAGETLEGARRRRGKLRRIFVVPRARRGRYRRARRRARRERIDVRGVGGGRTRRRRLARGDDSRQRRRQSR